MLTPMDKDIAYGAALENLGHAEDAIEQAKIAFRAQSQISSTQRREINGRIDDLLMSAQGMQQAMTRLMERSQDTLIETP